MRYCSDCSISVEIASFHAKGKIQKWRKLIHRREKIYLELKPSKSLWVIRPAEVLAAWRLLPLFVFLSSMIWSRAHVVEPLRKKKHFVQLIHRTKIVCAAHRKFVFCYFDLSALKRREMSIKWFRTSTLRLRVAHENSCCSMNHIYVSRAQFLGMITG